MIQTVTFPGLGWEFELNRVAFSLFGMDFFWYGLLIAIGFMCAMFYATNKAKTVGLNADAMTDVVFGATIIGVIGARMYYVAFNWDYYSEDLMRIFATRSGGLGIYGGIIFGFLGGWLLGKWKKVRFLPLADVASGGFLIAQSIGRWGNFINVEAFGSNTDLPWAMGGPAVENYLSAHLIELEELGMTIDPTMPVHPTFFYESMWCLLGFLLMQWVIKHRKFDGECFLFYIGWYGAGRMIIEGLRTDSLIIGNTGIRVSQLVAMVAVVVAVTAWLYLRGKLKKAPESMVLYVTTDESKELMERKKEEPAKAADTEMNENQTE